VRDGERRYFICNVHGLPKPGDKLDTPERLLASESLIAEGKRHEGSKMFMGDFNLNEHSESVRMFEQRGYKNLINEYAIETTRNHYCWDAHGGNKQLYSDYAFVSSESTVKHFEVLPDIVSDHQPLLLEVE
jgi:endonuclease/exonuclease/phosphatase family metal-dependent hydrolase